MVQTAPTEAPAALPGPAAAPARFTTVAVRLQKNQTLNQALFSLRLAAAEVNEVVEALRGHFPFRKARPGDQLRLERTEDGDLHRFTYRQGAADEWVVERLPDGTFEGAKRPVELTTEVARVAVTIESSLYESLGRADEDPGLAVLAADVLAWDVDFYQDVRTGDRMRILVEKVYADGKLLRYGEVLAAEYDGAATGRKRLFRYTDAAGQHELLRRRRQQRAARVPEVPAQVRARHLELRHAPPPRARLHAGARGRRLRRARSGHQSGRSATARSARRAGRAAAARRWS